MVIARQLTAAATSMPDINTKALCDFLVHDNAELRQRIYEFLKVIQPILIF